jgi:hypothetical protein
MRGESHDATWHKPEKDPEERNDAIEERTYPLGMFAAPRIRDTSQIRGAHKNHKSGLHCFVEEEDACSRRRGTMTSDQSGRVKVRDNVACIVQQE